jgi:N-acetylmuramoyl-L-alanine amidase
VRQISRLVLHHTAGPSGSLASITAEHIKRGFGGCGYHFLIGNGHGMLDGQCEQGRPDSVKGCGVWGNNTGALHCALIGNFEVTRPTEQQLLWLGEWLLHRSHTYGALTIVGHKEIALPGHGTLCPGRNFDLDAVRKWFAETRPLFLSHQPYRPLGAL